MYWFVADEHYFHSRIIQYCNRPFSSIEEMDETLISNHNSIVGKNDRVIHGGDFTLKNKQFAESIIKRLNGNHTFIKGSHDYWLPKSAPTRWEKL